MAEATIVEPEHRIAQTLGATAEVAGFADDAALLAALLAAVALRARAAIEHRQWMGLLSRQGDAGSAVFLDGERIVSTLHAVTGDRGDRMGTHGLEPGCDGHGLAPATGLHPWYVRRPRSGHRRHRHRRPVDACPRINFQGRSFGVA